MLLCKTLIHKDIKTQIRSEIPTENNYTPLTLYLVAFWMFQQTSSLLWSDIGLFKEGIVESSEPKSPRQMCFSPVSCYPDSANRSSQSEQWLHRLTWLDFYSRAHTAIWLPRWHAFLATSNAHTYRRTGPDADGMMEQDCGHWSYWPLPSTSVHISDLAEIEYAWCICLYMCVCACISFSAFLLYFLSFKCVSVLFSNSSGIRWNVITLKVPRQWIIITL